MNIYVWRHNRKFHSWSMINEPCVNEHFYTDALAIVQAESLEQAMSLLDNTKQGWIIEELKRIQPQVYSLAPQVIFSDVRGE